MIYIYNCFGGTHSSSLAAAVHLKKLPQDRVPTKKEISETDYFNKLTYKDMGKIIYRGTDEENNRVYSVGRGTSKILIPCLEEFITILGCQYGFKEKIVFSNMSPTVTFPMTVGGFLSRGLGIHSLGVPLLLLGSQQAYMKVVEVVKRTRDRAKKLQNPVLVLMNKNP